MKNVMIDLETLGTKPGSAILSIGAAFFELDGTVGETFYRNISTQSCVERGLAIDPRTQAWWRQQSEAARNAVLVDRQPLDDVAREFSHWFRAGGGVFVWGQGASFDPPLWEAASDVTGRSAPWKFYDVRDTRTVYAVCGFDVRSLPREGTHHNAIDDVLHQIKCVAAALKHWGSK